MDNQIKRTISYFLCVFAMLCTLVHLSAPLLVFANTESSFFPTWKLLSSEERKQFIAGYIQGWRDAEKVTSIAVDYVRQEPNKAVEGLKKVQELYDLSGVTPDSLITGIDHFYSDPGNHSASLSRAVSAAKNSLR